MRREVDQGVDLSMQNKRYFCTTYVCMYARTRRQKLTLTLLQDDRGTYILYSDDSADGAASTHCCVRPVVLSAGRQITSTIDVAGSGSRFDVRVERASACVEKRFRMIRLNGCVSPKPVSMTARIFSRSATWKHLARAQSNLASAAVVSALESGLRMMPSLVPPIFSHTYNSSTHHSLDASVQMSRFEVYSSAQVLSW